MKPHKFDEIAKRHPWILDRVKGWADLVGDVYPEGDPRKGIAQRKETKRYIRKEIEFIAFRPFSSLDLSLRMSSGTTEFASHATFFAIFYHFGGEVVCSRLRDVDYFGEETIQDTIDALRATEGEEARAAGKSFVIDYIVREDVASLKDVMKGSIKVQIYEVPLEAKLHISAPREVLPPADPAYVAYVNHQPMPPIMPTMV